MKITAITTIAQHNRGIELHIRNLRWALGDAARIIVNCFTHNSHPDLNVEYYQVQADPNKFYFFWDEMSALLVDDDADVYIFTEQDIVCTDRLKIDRPDTINISYDSHYLAIFDRSFSKLYPRIWEGYCKVPGFMVREAISQNINLGNHVTRKWRVDDLYTWYGRFIPLDEYLNSQHNLHEGDIDTMFEFSLYCYLNKYPWLSSNIDGYHIASDAVHFRGIDRLCHDCPDIYNSLESVLVRLRQGSDESKRIHDDMIGDCALMLMLSKNHINNEVLFKLLANKKSRSRLLMKIEAVRAHAHEWMNEEEMSLLSMSWNLIKSLELGEVYVC